MSAFTDILADDLDTFIDPDEFGEEHEIDGASVVVVLDEDILQRRGDKSGIDLGNILFYVKSEELGYRPIEGSNLLFDEKHAIVQECKESAGMYAVTLRVNR